MPTLRRIEDGTGRAIRSALFLVCLVALGACGRDGNMGPGPTLGSVRVTASTNGEDPDPDGYSTTLDGGVSRALGVNGTITFADVEPGDHDVGLADVAANCAVQGQNPRPVSVTAGAAADVTFGIVCAALSAPPAALAFTTEPGETELHQPLAAVEVTILDEAGNPVPGATNAVTVTLGSNLGGATLSGTTTVSAVDGVARFEDLGLDRRGTGYTLLAEAAGLEGVESEPFDVTFAWVEVTAGGAHACGLTPSGVAYCWGTNVSGQLGDGNAGDAANSDVPVAVATDQRFVQLSAGDFHTCGVTPDDDVYCWGFNGSGQLGDARGGSDSSIPRRVEGGLRFRQVSAGAAHTCALTLGAAFCWGSSHNGQLGDGNVGTESDLPVAVETALTFSLIAAGGTHTCALAGTDVHCWGGNGSGQIGDGTFDETPVPVLVEGDHTFVELGVGRFHSCALTLFNEAYCWGDNIHSELGIGNVDRDTSSVPLEVVGDLVFQVPSLTVDGFHACAKRIPGAGLFCWGENGDGQLGDGSAGGTRNEPVAVGGGITFSAVDAGGRHTCGVTPLGEAFCWGSNGGGALGNGNAGVASPTPVQVVDPP